MAGLEQQANHQWRSQMLPQPLMHAIVPQGAAQTMATARIHPKFKVNQALAVALAVVVLAQPIHC